ncbi:glucans biosynthesis glucosyltransferase MdoH [Leptospira ilyithenensis]|uniref:Glucans biosynthesis glucosyltransferase H n=1 Tax=Leptospira ilyithenensis TaxID=2484901 RepID=A0A4R9LU72_9LEPT|nr:glucans biosynthesis glucosyltransferase MdoH [Leptospira ilyithenensis]TGN13713.1 glucans biosynthesis glucosyltransferase MdoH [Leptospira ilyithenensis]
MNFFNFKTDPFTLLFRRVAFASASLIPVFWGISIFFRIAYFNEIGLSEYYQSITFILLFPLLSYGASVSIFGFIQRRKKGGDLLRISSLVPQDENFLSIVQSAPTAVVMPIYGEEIGGTIARVEVLFNSLKRSEILQNTDIFILSDTRDPDFWIKEEIAYFELCERLDSFDKIFYRRRKINLNGKSGNLADFCRRWGKLYRYMLVLDADSLMSSACIAKMIAIMEKDSTIGILQSTPKLFDAKTVFQKLNQFSSSLFSPIFQAGANYWQLNAGSYWGHNALIRIKPFMEYCALPHLPEYGAIGGKILSHDTIESALMRRAGFSVSVAYDLEGSYEESPPNILDSLKRDNRWCQGNLQHLWFLFAKRIPLLNRLHIVLGIFSYASAPIWAIYIILSMWNYWNDFRFLSFSLLPEEFEFFIRQIYFPLYFELLGLSITLLFLPRILGWIDGILNSEVRKSHGGFFGLTASFILETAFSILLAPIHLIYYTIFIFFTLFNKKIEWAPQNRDAKKLHSLRSIAQSFSGLTLLGISIAFFLNGVSEILFYSTLPIWLGWILSVPVVYFSGFTFSPSNRIFQWLFQTKEENNPSREITELAECKKRFKNELRNENIPGLFLGLVHPRYFQIHRQMQGKKEAHPSLSIKIKSSMAKLIEEGPEIIDKQTLAAILTNTDAIQKLHFQIWTTPQSEMAPYWKEHWPSLSL